MEKEPKIEKNLEERFREKGFQIERAQFPEDEPRQCDKCVKEDDFKFHNRGWLIEGEFYCEKHKDYALNFLRQIDEGAEKIRLEREDIMEERRKQSDLK